MNFLVLFILIVGIITASYVFLYKNKEVDEQKECDDGFYGSKCQYSNSKTCNNRGKVSVDENDKYTCKCSGNYTGKNCEKCKDGYKGSKCQFNNFYCNNNGSVRVDIYDKPICDCNLGWRGDKCQFNDNFTQDNVSQRCNNNGYYDPIRQICNCLPGYYGSLSCAYSNESNCSGKGTISDINENLEPPEITCNCNPGFKGSKCQFNENIICNGKGLLSVDSGDVYTCECSGNYTGQNCERCKPGFFGEKDNCRYSNKDTCNGGIVSVIPNTSPTPNPIYRVECTCPEGNSATDIKTGKRSGSRCQIDDNVFCNNRGYIKNLIDENSSPINAECECSANYEGKRCERCKPGRC